MQAETKLKLCKDLKEFYVFEIVGNKRIPTKKVWIHKDGKDYVAPTRILHIFREAFQYFKVGKVSFI